MQHGGFRQGKKKTGLVRIPTEWFALAPDENLGFWIRVRAKAKAEGVQLRNLEGINTIVRRMLHDKAN